MTFEYLVPMRGNSVETQEISEYRVVKIYGEFVKQNLNWLELKIKTSL